MKKKSLIVILVLCFYTAFSQEKGSFDIKLGYGIGGATSNSFVKDMASFGGLAIKSLLGDSSTKEELLDESFYISYQYAVSDKLMVGGTFAYQRMEDRWLNSEDEVIGEGRENLYTIAADLDYHYISNNFFQMYSGLGVGYTIDSENFVSNDIAVKDENSNGNFFNFQLNLLGLRFGRSFGGFLELGFGYKGLVNLGVSYQF